MTTDLGTLSFSFDLSLLRKKFQVVGDGLAAIAEQLEVIEQEEMAKQTHDNAETQD